MGSCWITPGTQPGILLWLRGVGYGEGQETQEGKYRYIHIYMHVYIYIHIHTQHTYTIMTNLCCFVEETTQNCKTIFYQLKEKQNLKNTEQKWEMSVMHSLVDWAQLRKESLSMNICQEKLPNLTANRRETEKEKWNKISKKCGVTIKTVT